MRLVDAARILAPVAMLAGLALGTARRRLLRRFRREDATAPERAITVDTGLRLSKFFGTSDSFWVGLQFDHDTVTAKERMADALARIRRFESAST